MKRFAITIALLSAVLCLLFFRNFSSHWLAFSNDNPYGQLVADEQQLPGAFGGDWQDLNSIGFNAGAAALNVSNGLRWVCESLFGHESGVFCFSNIYVPFGLLTMGLGAWAFFTRLKLHPAACVLGGLALMLNTQFFSGACWGIAADEIAIGFDLLAMALVTGVEGVGFVNCALAGLCVGINVSEAADVGVLLSVFVAIYTFVCGWSFRRNWLAATVHGGVRVIVMAIFALIIAAQTVAALSGITSNSAGMTAADKSTQEHWDYATEWSLPKTETLGIVVPGLFGYRMDTPLNACPVIQDFYTGGQYWGGMGRTPAIDRYFDSGSNGEQPQGIMRFGYGGYYCGLLVLAMAVWSVCHSLLRGTKPCRERYWTWFWAVVVILSLCVSWGRFAPVFYGALYDWIPGFYTIRNPAKFLVFVELGLVVLFTYGVHGVLTAPHTDRLNRLFERGAWVFAGVAGTVCVAYNANKAALAALAALLTHRGFSVDDSAAIAGFSIHQMFIFCLLTIVLTSVLAAVFYFSTRKPEYAFVIIAGFLMFDLGRSDLPFVIDWNADQKYADNDVVNFLATDPQEHRVAVWPYSQGQDELLNQVYGMEWAQHLFPSRDIQSLDKIQMPREPQDLARFEGAFKPHNRTQDYLVMRFWQLTNTRYLLIPTDALGDLRAGFPDYHFNVVHEFNIGLKPGFTNFNGDASTLTAGFVDHGQFAIVEFTDALPRAALYSQWTQGDVTTLISPGFDVGNTVVVDRQLPFPPQANDGRAVMYFYSPTEVEVGTTVDHPAMLLLNDHYDSHWRATIDGKPTPVFRANYVMQGVMVPPGHHTVVYRFTNVGTSLLLTMIGWMLLATFIGWITFTKI